MKYFLLSILIVMTACQSSHQPQGFTGADGEIRLITLAPGHFHAALLQKTDIKQLNKTVQVYAPKGPELDAHLALINSYNTRSDNPTAWVEKVYDGNDFFEKMLAEKKGNVVVLAGNNKLKTSYILQSVNAGLNVLGDKPMAIDKKSFEELKKAFRIAAKKNVLLYDIMTERYDIINILNRELMQDKELFGTLEKGTPGNPAVQIKDVHHFFKTVSGKSLIRPAWYYDVEQQGEGIADVTTHHIDLIHWKCFPDVSLDYTKDIQVTGAKHWPTKLSKSDFCKSTLLKEYPEFLKKDVKNSTLYVYANGSINYTVKGVNVGLETSWEFEAPEGVGDTHSSIMRGTKASIFILQGKEQGYTPKLYIRKADAVGQKEFISNLKRTTENLHCKVSLKETENGMIELEIPSNLKEGHEALFARVAEKYFGFLTHRNMPAWEVPNMLTKYYITTTAVEMARKED